MTVKTIALFSMVAWLAIAIPGPAVLLALRNGASSGVRAVFWSSLGNITGICFLSLASILGLGAILRTSAALFQMVKIIGAMYLFYIGFRHMFGRRSFRAPAQIAEQKKLIDRQALYVEALLLAATNPKAILFFTALFPQFVNTHGSLIPQVLTLTTIFMVLSFSTLMAYSIAASRAVALLGRPRLRAWIDRSIGALFMSFGAALLTIRRPAT